MAENTDTQIVFPTPSGLYPVGQIIRSLTDPMRTEVFSEAGGQREIAITVCYPAAPAGDTAPYIPHQALSGFAEAVGLPADLLSGFSTHHYSGVPAAAGQFPVLLFSPGFGTPNVLYTSLLDEVASHGYIVVSVSHSYSVGATIFPDGRIAASSPAGTDLTTDASRDAVFAVWVADMRFALDQLEALNTSDPLLAGHMDLTRVGSFGHSFGGATAAEAAYHDKRISAAINMDGGQLGAVVSNGLTKPFILMLGNSIPDPTDEELAAAKLTRDDYERRVAEARSGWETLLAASTQSCKITVDGTAHMAFATDLALAIKELAGLIPPNRVGTLDGTRAYTIIAACVVAFFNQYVKGDEGTLDILAADYPELTFEGC